MEIFVHMNQLITTGKGPDFVMRRGREMLSYKCRIHIGETDVAKEIIRNLSNRSLIEIAKEASQIAITRLDRNYLVDKPIYNDNKIEIQLNARSQTQSLVLKLVVPEALSVELQQLISSELFAFMKRFS